MIHEPVPASTTRDGPSRDGNVVSPSANITTATRDPPVLVATGAKLPPMYAGKPGTSAALSMETDQRVAPDSTSTLRSSDGAPIAKISGASNPAMTFVD